MRKYIRYRKFTEEEMEEIIRRKEAGESYKKISRDLGLSYHKVRESEPEQKRKIREYQRQRYEQEKNREINSYLEKISKLSEHGYIKDIKYFQNFLQDFLYDPFSYKVFRKI